MNGVGLCVRIQGVGDFVAPQAKYHHDCFHSGGSAEKQKKKIDHPANSMATDKMLSLDYANMSNQMINTNFQ